MNSNYEISVVVSSYKPSFEKMKLTLDSILAQKKIGFQLVITDDGSPDDLFPQIEEYLKERNFFDYVLVPAKENKGTVHNIYKGTKAASAEYVKGISPGDYLAYDTALREWLDALKKSGKQWSFADIYCYHMEDGKAVVTSEEAHPQILDPYEKGDDQGCRWNYVVLGDNVVGASLLSTRDLKLRYLEKFLDKVIYVEDGMLRVMMFDGIVGYHFPKEAVMYEYGSGISTSNSSFWAEKIRNDWAAINSFIKDDKDPFKQKMLKAIELRKDESFIGKVKKHFIKGYAAIKYKRKHNLRYTNTMK